MPKRIIKAISPITMPPVLYFAYKLGAWMLGISPEQGVSFEVSLHWIMEELTAIWQPLLLGCFIFGTVSAAVGNVAIRLL